METVSLGSLFPFANPLAQFREAHSFGLIDIEAPPDELLDLFGHGNCLFELNGHFGHFVDEFAFSSALPGSLSVEHLVDHDADRPDVVLDRVDILLERLGGHVERTAHVVLLLLERGTA